MCGALITVCLCVYIVHAIICINCIEIMVTDLISDLFDFLKSYLLRWTLTFSYQSLRCIVRQITNWRWRIATYMHMYRFRTTIASHCWKSFHIRSSNAGYFIKAARVWFLLVTYWDNIKLKTFILRDFRLKMIATDFKENVLSSSFMESKRKIVF